MVDAPEGSPALERTTRDLTDAERADLIAMLDRGPSGRADWIFWLAITGFGGFAIVSATMAVGEISGLLPTMILIFFAVGVVGLPLFLSINGLRNSQRKRREHAEIEARWRAALESGRAEIERVRTDRIVLVDVGSGMPPVGLVAIAGGTLVVTAWGDVKPAPRMPGSWEIASLPGIEMPFAMTVAGEGERGSEGTRAGAANVDVDRYRVVGRLDQTVWPAGRTDTRTPDEIVAALGSLLRPVSG